MAAQIAKRHKNNCSRGIDVFSRVCVLNLGIDSIVTLNKKR